MVGIKRLGILLLVALLAGIGPMVANGADDVAGLINEGEAKLAAGDIDAGIAVLRRATEQDPESALAQTRLGGALVLKQDYVQAIETFRVAIAVDAGNAPAFVGMAIAYLHSGDYALARAAMEEARRIDPAKGADIDKLLAWIEQRESGAPAAH